jgi:hypothetical protein
MTNGTRREWGVSITLRPLFTPGKDPVPIVQEAGWAPGPVWTCAENLAPTGIRSPEYPARSQSLYWLRYTAHFLLCLPVNIYPHFRDTALFRNTEDVDFISTALGKRRLLQQLLLCLLLLCLLLLCLLLLCLLLLCLLLLCLLLLSLVTVSLVTVSHQTAWFTNLSPSSPIHFSSIVTHSFFVGSLYHSLCVPSSYWFLYFIFVSLSSFFSLPEYLPVQHPNLYLSSEVLYY